MSIHDERVRINHVLLNIIFYALNVTDADEELFEDNPEEYIRRDIEGSGNAQTCSCFFMLFLYNIATYIFILFPLLNVRSVIQVSVYLIF